MSRKSLLGSVLVLALLLVGTLSGFVFAATTTDDPAAKMKEATELFITKLAANLNIDETTLEAALEETQQEILAEQVAAGTITQEQADKIIERGLQFGFMSGHGGPPPDGQNGQDGKGKPSGPPPGNSSDDDSEN